MLTAISVVRAHPGAHDLGSSREGLVQTTPCAPSPTQGLFGCGFPRAEAWGLRVSTNGGDEIKINLSRFSQHSCAKFHRTNSAHNIMQLFCVLIRLHHVGLLTNSDNFFRTNRLQTSGHNHHEVLHVILCLSILVAATHAQLLDDAL